MSNLDLGSVNYLAVLAAALASFLVGGVWYGGIFAKAWVRLHGYGEEDTARFAKSQARTFGLFAVGDLVTALVFALLMQGLAEPGLTSALCLAGLLWLGISATNALMHAAAHHRPVTAYAIDVFYHLFSLLAIALVLGLWR